MFFSFIFLTNAQSGYCSLIFTLLFHTQALPFKSVSVFLAIILVLSYCFCHFIWFSSIIMKLAAITGSHRHCEVYLFHLLNTFVHYQLMIIFICRFKDSFISLSPQAVLLHFNSCLIVGSAYYEEGLLFSFSK